MLVNLIGNAIKFTEEGTVTVTIHTPEKLENGSFQLQFDVTDTGIGEKFH